MLSRQCRGCKQLHLESDLEWNGGLWDKREPAFDTASIIWPRTTVSYWTKASSLTESWFKLTRGTDCRALLDTGKQNVGGCPRFESLYSPVDLFWIHPNTANTVVFLANTRKIFLWILWDVCDRWICCTEPGYTAARAPPGNQKKGKWKKKCHEKRWDFQSFFASKSATSNLNEGA